MRTDESNSTKTALLTGANSGIGFETGFQLASAGYGKVILVARTRKKADAARRRLIERGAADIFESLAVDLSEAASTQAGTGELLTQGRKLNLLILNAGTAGGGAIARNSAGFDHTFASTLAGHHAVTAQLLNAGGMTADARIIIAGSEASRGDVLGMTIPDLDILASADFAGNMYALLKAFSTGSYPPKHVPSTAYAIAKLCAAWWAAEIATRLPEGMAVFAVSPGNTPATNMGRHLPWPVRELALPMLHLIGPALGMAHSVRSASERYLESSRFGAERSGSFFASPAKRLTGPLVEQYTRWLQDAGSRRDAYKLIVEMAGGVDCVSQRVRRD